MFKEKIMFLLVMSLFFQGCAAVQVKPEAANVDIVIEKPNNDKCKFLGEVIGSQGNWFTGDYTSNENLVVGARNELRNEAYRLGGNVVFIQNMANSSAWGSLGTTNTTVIGRAYKCVD